MKNPIDLAIAVTATDRASMDRRLNEAVTMTRTRAMQESVRAFWSLDMTSVPSRLP
ncbi:hypothetical protein [Pseudarthrobacter sp. SSS035]|uniref:hypothetical protein n=1 Tax=Pseudarthrobacter sp. SSS035 TaxID=2931399 RepID=UPI00200D154E|nr:hypothetical protein [Pseudarthrobacter sp. SSS035]